MAAVVDALQTPTTTTTYTTIQAGVKNLELKATHALKRRNWSDLVEVHVRTLRGRKAIAGYTVLYCIRGGSRVRFYWRELRTKSTPAVDRVPPGFYDFAVERGTAVVKQIGGQGQSAIAFDLEVPPK